MVSSNAIRLLVFVPAIAWAQPTREGMAQALFDEARDLFTKEQYAQACEKFAASQEMDPKGGTLLNLAICHEKIGRIGTAWVEFQEAKHQAVREGRADREKFAQQRVEALGPIIPRLRFRAAAGTRVMLDRVEVAPAAWSVGVPVDPGEHVVEASAPGRSSFRSTVNAEKGKTEEIVIELPELVTLQPAHPPPPPPPREDKPRRFPWVLGAIGLAGLGAGTFFGVRTLSERSDAEALCAAGRCDEGTRVNDQAGTLAWASNIAFGVGVITLGIATIVWLTR
jgi:hypothetical protein